MLLYVHCRTKLIWCPVLLQSLEELVKAVSSLESDIITKRPGIKLVVVDSIAYHFRYVDDEAKVLVHPKKKTY